MPPAERSASVPLSSHPGLMTCRSDVSFRKSTPNDRKGLLPVIHCAWRERPERAELIDQVDHVADVQMGVSLDASYVPVTAHHHNLKLVQSHPCYFGDARVSKLVKPYIIIQSHRVACAPHGLRNTVWSYRKNSGIRIIESSNTPSSNATARLVRGTSRDPSLPSTTRRK